MNDKDRDEEIRQNLPRLEKFVNIENPKYIIVCKRGSVRNTIQTSSIMSKYRENETIFFLPFPSNGRQGQYREGLINALTIVGLQRPVDDFICPYPKRWYDIFNDLCSAYENKIGEKMPSGVIGIRNVGGPPTPLILNGWVFSNDFEKKLRWIETVEWAKKHDFLHLMGVEEKDKYRG